MTNHCDVCGYDADRSLKLRAGPGGSFRYCERCYTADVLPYEALLNFLWSVEWDRVSPMFQHAVRETCHFVGKNVEDFKEDCRVSREHMARYMRVQ